MEPKLILAVDDAEPVLIVLHQVLLHLGHRVVLASNGSEAVAQAARHLPDLILLDVHMPGEDPRETMLALAREGGAGNTPVIALVGGDGEQTVSPDGFAGVVRKPIAMPALVRALEKCLGRVPRGGERYRGREEPEEAVAEPPLA
jgi:CheY-like chemotaxis protein